MFRHKMALAHGELLESRHWMRVAQSCGAVHADETARIDDGEQLDRILGASLRTLARNQPPDANEEPEAATS